MINRKIVMIPGPSPTVRSIQNEMGRDTCAFGDSDFVKDYKETVEDVAKLLNCSGQAFIIAGTGSLAMEMAIANNCREGDNILIVSNGFFGDRFIDIAKRKKLNVDVLSAEWGKVVNPEEIDKKLNNKKYDLITVSHVDTATGALAPIKEIGDMIFSKHKEVMYVVDGVAATMGAYENFDDMHIDVLITGSQKAFGVAPGLAILLASEKSLTKRKELGEVIPEYYIDYEKWIPIMKDPSKYFATPAINLIWALKESVRIIKEEGVENRYNRHIKHARAMREALKALGFKILAQEGYEAPTLSNVLYMDGVDDATFRNMAQEEGIIVAGGLAAYAGKMFRIGHMGNVDTHDLVCSIAAIERVLYRMGINISLGKGVGVLMQELLR